MQNVKVFVLRQKNGESKAYWQVFNYEGSLHIPVTTLLDKLNDNDTLVDIDGRECEPILWKCSCQQGLCGSCAMVINETPALGCQVFCDSVVSKENEIKIQPLSKFPVICDLIVDRSEMFDVMKEMRLWLDQPAKTNVEKVAFQYEVSQCLMCGLCLEACPNYTKGDFFVGAPTAVAAVKLVEQEEGNEHKKFMKKKYNERVFKGCSKVLACQEICPMNIPIQTVMSRMNRMSIWKIWNFLGNK